jgi:hypothetical protein
MKLVPIKLKAARRFVDMHHEHNNAPHGWLFGVSLVLEHETIGVAIGGRPTGRGLDDGTTIEVTRVCVASKATYRNACSRLYGAVCRAAAALGYVRAITYTLAEEDAASVRASGFLEDAVLEPRAAMKYTGQGRYDKDLFGTPTRPEGAKVRWVRWL